MNFSLIGHGGFFNRGCEAIIRTTVGLLGSGFRHPQITLASGDPDNDKRLPLEQRIKIVSSAPLRGIWTPLSPAWILRQVRKLHSSEKSRETALLPMIGLIKRSDIVLSVGGDNFTPEYGFPEYWFTLHDLVRKHGKKLVVWSASIGPFPKDDHLPYIVRSFKAADLITARDSATVGYLKEIGITRNVRKVADTAFLLPAQKVYDHFVLPDTRKDTVGINLSPLPGYLKDRSIDMDAVDEMARFIERMTRTTGFTVLLIPHVTENYRMNNDHTYMKLIRDRFNDPGRIDLLLPNYNAMQTKYIISRCRFFIGARMHATIAALSSGVPTISISYSAKSRAINEDIFGHHEYMLPSTGLTAQRLSAVFDRVVSDEAGIRATLAAKIPGIQEEARLNLAYMKQII
jgi:polysaccharide pyruvyl transferase WcaK-like protein